MAISTTHSAASEAATISDSAQTLSDVGFSDAVLKSADVIFFGVRGADVSFRYDGTAPTATVGYILADGERLTIRGNENINALQFIRTASTDAELFATIETYR